MKIVLIGNKGQVGHEVEDLALSKGFEIVGFDVNNLDITDFNTVACSLKDNASANIVINAAAYTNVDKAEDDFDSSYAVNCLGVENLATVCFNNNLPLLHISTDYVFDGFKKGPYSEDDIPRPLSIYGKSKLAGEQALARICHKYIILRVSWVFGRHGSNFVKTILRLGVEREELNIIGDQYGCPTPAADVARVLLELAEKIYNGQQVWGIYHYCSLPATNWCEFAKKIIAEARNSILLKTKKINNITTQQYPTKATRPHNTELLVKKIISDYGVKRRDWDSYLAKVIREIVENETI